MCGSSSSPPPAPDYAGAAAQTAAGNLQAAKYATAANRINQNTPYGSLTYTRGNPGNDDDPQWTQNVALSDTGQQLLDRQNSYALGLGDATNKSLGQVQGQGPMDLSNVDKIADQAYSQQTSRLDPQWQQKQQMQETQLVNQGLRPGTEAYDNAMRDFNFARNDAYNQARVTANNSMPQTYQLAQAAFDQPLNRLNALRTGQQVTNPTFQNVPQQATTAGPDYLGAAQAGSQYNMGLYNAGQASDSNMMGGLFSLGAAGLKAFGPAIAASDMRLKSNIVRVGTHPIGIGIYEYDIFDRRERGVMAQEVEKVMPDAVIEHPAGFKMVDYGKINSAERF